MYIYAVIIIHNGRFRFLPSISSLSCVEWMLSTISFVTFTFPLMQIIQNATEEEGRRGKGCYDRPSRNELKGWNCGIAKCWVSLLLSMFFINNSYLPTESLNNNHSHQ